MRSILRTLAILPIALLLALIFVPCLVLGCLIAVVRGAR